eukprot:g492.t1
MLLGSSSGTGAGAAFGTDRTGAGAGSAFGRRQGAVQAVSDAAAWSVGRALERHRAQKARAVRQEKGGKLDPPLHATIVLWMSPSYWGHPGTYNCGLGTCELTRDRARLQEPETHGVWFYGPDIADELAQAADPPGDALVAKLPLPRARRHQWILENDESPCFYSRMMRVRSFLALFNHSATYDASSTWPVWPTQHGLPAPPLGAARGGGGAGAGGDPLSSFFRARPPVPLAEKNRLRRARGGGGGRGLAPVVLVMSNCNSETGRDGFAAELMKHIEVDSYGGCLHNRDFPAGKDKWEMNRDAWFLDMLARYKFALAFENCYCTDYVTEKLVRPLLLGVVPVYLGAPNAAAWAPGTAGAASGVIDARAFDSPRALAAHLRALDGNDTAYAEMLAFKQGGVGNGALRARFRDAAGTRAGQSATERGVCRVCDRVLAHARDDPAGAASTSGSAGKSAATLAPDILPPSLMKCLPLAKQWRPGAVQEEEASDRRAQALHDLIWRQRRAAATATNRS